MDVCSIPLTKGKYALVDKRFGRLLVISRVGFNKWRNAIWECSCECGAKVNIVGGNLTNGHTKSCGWNIKKAFI